MKASRQFRDAFAFGMVAALWIGCALSAWANPTGPDVPPSNEAAALELLSALRNQFPENTFFPREIARLQSAH
jgi:hypothetical protein